MLPIYQYIAVFSSTQYILAIGIRLNFVLLGYSLYLKEIKPNSNSHSYIQCQFRFTYIFEYDYCHSIQIVKHAGSGQAAASPIVGVAAAALTVSLFITHNPHPCSPCMGG